jgi:large subunit ribosomal protein L2
MGKRIIQQRRGKGSSTYRSKKKAYKIRVGYPNKEGKGRVVDIINSPAHTAPLAKIEIGGDEFLNPAHEKMFQGQEIEIGGKLEEGNILSLKKIPIGTRIYNVEKGRGDGGKLIRSGGNSAVITDKEEGKVKVLLPSKKEKWFKQNCRATVGVIAGQGRLEKPVVKAGKKYKMMKAKGKLWPKTSAVSMNAVDHPFGSGRGRNVSHGRKGKTPKLNAPPGAKVGSVRPKRTGKRKK